MESEAGLLAEIEALVSDRVLVFGSLPPAGRDLDLLVRPAEQSALEEGLAGAGFEHAGGLWLRLRESTPEVVDLEPAASWGLGESELAALFDEGLTLPQQKLLVSPAPHHALLILARRRVRSRDPLGGRARERLEQALTPEAVSKARDRAALWGSQGSLELLLSDGEQGTASAGSRAAALARELGSGRAVAKLPTVLAGRATARARRARVGMVIAFSGLDGCGKSSQTVALRESLDRLGISTEIVWTSLTGHPRWLHLISALAKRSLALLSRAREAPAVPADEAPRLTGGRSAPFDPGRELRRRSPLITAGWTAVLALQFVAKMRRSTSPPLLRGQVVFCDRHVLDAAVELRYNYGENRSFALQNAILRLGAPRARHAFFLDVPAATASRRKADFELVENERRAELYRAEARRLGIARIDGDRPAETVTAEITGAIWPDLVRARGRAG